MSDDAATSERSGRPGKHLDPADESTHIAAARAGGTLPAAPEPPAPSTAPSPDAHPNTDATSDAHPEPTAGDEPDAVATPDAGAEPKPDSEPDADSEPETGEEAAARATPETTPRPATVVPPPASVAAPAPMPPLFGDRWRGPSDPPPRTVFVGAAVAGITVAAAVPEARPGVGWFVTALVLAAVAVAVGRRTPRTPSAAATDGAWLLVGVALAGVAALRDAEWFGVLCLLAAAGAASLAVAGRSFRSVLVSGLVGPVAALRGVPWIVRAARQGNLRGTGRVAVAALASVVLLAVFGSLLAAGDAAFANVVEAIVPTVDGDSVTRAALLFLLGALSVVGAAFLLLAPPAPQAPRAPSRLRGLEWALPIGLLAGLFALFVGVQFAALFGSDDHVLRTTGLTYAEYARSGFWQLLMVTVLALGVIVAGSRWAPQGTAAERTTKRAVLGALAVLTLVIVASALSRMWLYQQAYGFTVLRLVVLAFELWLGAGFLIVLWSVLRLRAGRPTRGMVAAGAAGMLVLALLDPERFVADHNVDRYAATGQIDIGYHSRLSADAVPALVRLPEPVRSCILAPILGRLDADGADWRSANLARAAATGTPANREAPCSGVG